MASLGTRIVSALFALALILGAYYGWGTTGLFVFSALAIMRASFEYGRIVYERTVPALCFATLCLLLFLTFFLYPNLFLATFTLSGATVIAGLTWLAAKNLPLHRVVSIQASTALGFFYCILLPIQVVRIIYFDPSGFWFPVFLSIVFATDTFAYFFGIQFGKHRLLEPVSPKKSVEGSLGGIVGALLVGVICSAYFNLPTGPMLLASVGVSVLAQMGDLFESAMKRVANVKDSGRFMPGHGGLLDRLDGVYISAPLFYLLLQTFLA